MRSTPLMREGENLKSKIFTKTFAEDGISLQPMPKHGHIVAGKGEEKNLTFYGLDFIPEDVEWRNRTGKN
jgi:hypothetical protein